MNLKRTLVSALTLVTLAGCSKNPSGGLNESSTSKKAESIFHQLFNTSSSLKIVDQDGSAVANAQILIGKALNDPYQNNLLNADGSGQFTAPKEWSTAQSVTIQAPGYIRTTFLQQTPAGQTFHLKKKLSSASYEITGQTPGVNVVPGDGNAYVSLVLPLIQKADLMNFNVGAILSPQKDHISVLGKDIALPSNLAIPKQKQTYIFPFTLNKPTYREFLSSTGTHQVVALAAKFPFRKTVDDIRDGGANYKVVNDLEITSGGVKTVNITGASTPLDIPVTGFTIGDQREVVAADVSDDNVMMGVALGEINGGMFPTDVKTLNSGQSNHLRVQSGQANVQLLTVLKKQSEMQGGAGEDRMSATILPFTHGMKPESLDLLDNPTLVSNTQVQVPKPNLPSGLNALATYARLQTLSKQSDKEDSETEVVSPIWEVYVTGWVDSFEIPAWPGEAAPAGGNMRWSVAMMAGTNSQTVDLGPSLMQNVTHVTNTSVDF